MSSKALGTELQVDRSDIELRKLTALAYMINGSTTENIDVKDYLEFICLNPNPNQILKILTGIGNFNERLATEMRKNGPDDSVVPKPMVTSASNNLVLPWLQTTFNPSFWGSSQKLFGALVDNLGPCKSSQTHSVLLNLKGLQPPKPQDQQAEFEILLSLCQKQDSWQETFCRILYENADGSDDRGNMLVESVCKAAHDAKDYHEMLHIIVQGESLYQHNDNKDTMYPAAVGIITVSELLDSGFLGRIDGLNLEDRSIIALNLAQSLLQLHNGPWLQALWTPDTIIFLYTKGGGDEFSIIHNAFVRCTIPSSPPNLSGKFGHLDKYALLLSFGRLLLELAKGKRLPNETTANGGFSPYMTLKKNFKNEVNTKGLTNDYKAAIEGCLNFHKFVRQETDANEEDRIRTAIFKRIVQPLDNNLRPYKKDSQVTADIERTRARENSPMEVTGLPHPRTLHSPTPGRITGRQVEGLRPCNHDPTARNSSNSYNSCASFLQPPTAEAKEAIWGNCTTIAGQHLLSSCEKTENGDASSSSKSEPGPDEARGGLLGTFDTETPGGQNPESLEWGKTFKKLSWIYSNRFQYTNSDEPVKVAILDTGIDKNHPDFQNPRSKLKIKKGIESISPVKGEEKQIERIKACQNFCDNREDTDVTDIDGHGTHVAGIILQLAPNAELYIARVCRGDESYGRSSPTPKATNKMPKQSADGKRVHPGGVAKAIEWAIRHKVHLVNMSFGYKDWNAEIDKALKKARELDIVVFAAASNFGNHNQVAWPARDRERAICVHSSIDLGTICSTFTPKAYPRTTNFMVVGESVCSHWPVSKGGGFRMMSGTSTATPVATAVAALLLAFTRQNAVDKTKKDKVEDEIGPVRLEELQNMRSLLEHVCEKVGEYYWIHPELLWRGYKSEMQERPGMATEHAWEEIRRALQR
ncbi:peptidase S8/S53 domain-containing protein [Xylaria telfairii]|nr:peptidase S8/S53 domain-containing protein [Xylaria telfairii]